MFGRNGILFLGWAKQEKGGKRALTSFSEGEYGGGDMAS
jgi:hypothetical protein